MVHNASTIFGSLFTLKSTSHSEDEEEAHHMRAAVSYTSPTIAPSTRIATVPEQAMTTMATMTAFQYLPRYSLDDMHIAEALIFVNPASLQCRSNLARLYELSQTRPVKRWRC
ncbi:hypothetical protein HRR85_002858 [Exophiala dermatitidis]|nr:hypothetical protein HRR85_002858 [Exophiala dermatitidis]